MFTHSRSLLLAGTRMASLSENAKLTLCKPMYGENCPRLMRKSVRRVYACLLVGICIVLVDLANLTVLELTCCQRLNF